LWTHDRRETKNWLGTGALAGQIAPSTKVQTLFFPGKASGFVELSTGRTKLRSLLVPIDDELQAAGALKRLQDTLRIVAPDVRPQFLHVGTKSQDLSIDVANLCKDTLIRREGSVVSTILSVAREIGAELIAMPTAGRHGVFDVLRGSTTERVLREAGLPILAVPI